MAKSGRIIAEKLQRPEWKESVLPVRPKSTVANVTLAARLRAEKTMTAQRIAVRLEMRTRTHLKHLL